MTLLAVDSNMVTQSCSNSIDPHSVISNLRELVKSIHPSTPDKTKQEGADQGLKCNSPQLKHLADKLKREVDHIQASLNNLTVFMADLGKRVQPLADQINDGRIESEDPVLMRSLMELSSAVTHLKFQLPFTPLYSFIPLDPPSTSESGSTGSLSPAPMEDSYGKLEEEEKQSLWCFVVFPEGAMIKKRVLINWWIGEGLLDNYGSPTLKLEQKGEMMLKLFEEMEFIKPVGRCSNTWSMEPSVRSFMETIQDGNHNYNSPNKRLILQLKSQRGGEHYVLGKHNPVVTIFNINGTGANAVKVESDPDTTTSLRVLHLGRSTISESKQHIQVEGSELLDGLGKMKSLRLLSLQGILSLTKLPMSVCASKSLMILDLRACQALESLPSRIRRIKTLTHLDLSECFTRQWLPKAICELSNLEVLKGFVIGHNHKKGLLRRNSACTLHDLRKLPKLHTLSVFVVRGGFPQCKDLKDLASFKELVKLKIVWLTEQEEPYQGREISCKGDVIMRKLEKLDLWRVPEEAAPLLLNPGRYPKLNKLYIRGSPKLQRINDNAASEQKWTVKILRLLGLPGLGVNEDLSSMFPELSYLEKSECPDLQFPDCNEEGVWTI